MTNKKLGNDFERELCEILRNNGAWVHNFAQNQAGQPADVIAVKGNRAWLIDCKVCTGNRFPLSRVEDNQRTSMSLWSDAGNGMGWFAVKFLSSGNIYMASNGLMLHFGKQSWTEEMFENYCPKLDEWIRLVGL